MISIITLTTDFGSGSPYVAAMKGVILGINPAAQLIDLSNEIGPQQVRQAAVLLAEGSTWFPTDTIHIAVVDPGVGTERRLLYARIGDQQYLAPDNGLLSLLAKRNRPSRIVELASAEYWMPEVSHTFHGRDILAPVAAQVSLGLEPERLGPSLQEFQMLHWPEPRRAGNRIDGAVQWIDRFGNLITNISAAMLADAAGQGRVHVTCCGKTVEGLSRTYGDHKHGDLIALVGSSGFLELAAVNSNASQLLNAAGETPITVDW